MGSEMCIRDRSFNITITSSNVFWFKKTHKGLVSSVQKYTKASVVNPIIAVGWLISILFKIFNEDSTTPMFHVKQFFLNLNQLKLCL